jgi:tRNA nucleotidyltransferase/poly(A) polymerase
MKFYLVGGAVRDIALNKAPRDIDFLVVGATHQDMLNMDFIPIEATSFPVYHHPVSKAEFALARRERKVGTGYHGFEVDFSPDVTLEEDLFRRDFTINAMAIEVYQVYDDGSYEVTSGDIIDPFNGLYDLETKVLRHVSDHFMEDPVRVLRAARFLARWPEFHIDAGTLNLISEMRENGELNSLTPERIYLELTKTLMEKMPSRFFQYLYEWRLSHLVQHISVHSTVFDYLPDTVTLTQRFAILAASHCYLSASDIVEKMTALKTPSEIIKVMLKAKFLDYQFMQLTSDFMTDCKLAVWVFETLKGLNAVQDPRIMRELTAALPFYISFKDKVQVWMLLNYAAGIISRTRFADLTEDQQKTLKGPDVGRALDELKIKQIQKLIDTINGQ